MWSRALVFCLLIIVNKAFTAESPEQFPGGKGSTINLTKQAFSLPSKNITKQHRKDFVVGRSTFRQNWVAAPSSVKSLQGLGPTFNTQSCIACHVNDGRGGLQQRAGDEIIGLLFRLSVPGKSVEGGPLGVPNYGDQLNPRAILNVKPEGKAVVTTTEINGVYPDGQKYTLMKPLYSFEHLNYGPLPKDVMVSPRIAPMMIGLGLLEAIKEEDLLSYSDPEDKNEDGISGRPNYVWDFVNKKKAVGRFGWKSNQPSVLQQNAGALLGDMGVTSHLFSMQNCPKVQKDCAKSYILDTPEISEKDIERLTIYAKTISVPQRRSLSVEEVERGNQLMEQVSCVKCHIPHFKTGKDEGFPENSEQDIYPYTDLLLHDMGEDLTDNRPDYEAEGAEWRTAPLWGIGLIKIVNGHTRLMHDGRARNIEEAILWHGGEALKSRNDFMALKRKDRNLLIKYVEAL